MKVAIKSRSEMSNTRYHQFGKPTWWARIGSGNNAQFAKVPYTRGDTQLDAEIEVPDGTTAVYIGVGPNNKYGWRETINVS